MKVKTEGGKLLEEEEKNQKAAQFGFIEKY